MAWRDGPAARLLRGNRTFVVPLPQREYSTLWGRCQVCPDITMARDSAPWHRGPSGHRRDTIRTLEQVHPGTPPPAPRTPQSRPHRGRTQWCPRRHSRRSRRTMSGRSGQRGHGLGVLPRATSHFFQSKIDSGLVHHFRRDDLDVSLGSPLGIDLLDHSPNESGHSGQPFLALRSPCRAA